MVRRRASFPVAIMVMGWVVLSVLGTSVRAEHLEATVRLLPEEVTVKGEDGGARVAVSVEGYERLAQAGLPALPYRIVNVLLPQGEEVGEYEFTGSRRMRLTNGVGALRLVGPMVSEDGVEGEGSSARFTCRSRVRKSRRTTRIRSIRRLKLCTSCPMGHRGTWQLLFTMSRVPECGRSSMMFGGPDVLWPHGTGETTAARALVPVSIFIG